MSITVRALVLTVALTMLVAPSATVAAQQSTGSTTVAAPIAGRTNNGGVFNGTLLIRSFELRNGAILAIGTLSGTLSDATTGVRNVVTQVPLPVDAIGSSTAAAPDAVAAQGSCEALHVELESAALNVLGSNVVLDSVAFDIATARTSVASQATPRAIASTATTTASSSPPRSSGILGATQLSPPTPTTPTDVLRPGTAASVRSTSAGQISSSAQPRLGELLCSVNRLSVSVGSRAQVVQMLNQILGVLG